jgi:hypothetical protein
MTSTLTFRFDPDYLNKLVDKYREDYSQAKPFPHSEE